MTSMPNLIYLLPSTSYTLAYSLPLLLLSLVLTFSGTFLMLDRSRSFPPSTNYATLPGVFEKNKKPKFVWFLEGGVGGLACGYTTGLHLTTFLSLVIPTKTTSTSLSPKSFLAVWILVCTFTTLLAGRYRYAAMSMAGLSGGALSSLALSVIIHPSLAPRVILMAIFVSLLTFLVLFFYFVPKFHSWLLHPTLRFCTSTNGAFGVTLSISLLLHPKEDAWANVWERLWLHDGPTWGTSGEKGLSAAFCIFLVVGVGVDWALRRWLGECPDEKWDNYLANYMANLPNQSGRAGIFEPPKSLWERFFSTSKTKHDPILFPSDSDLKASPQSDLTLDDRSRSPSLTKAIPIPATGGGFIKKSRTRRYQHPTTRKRKPIKFGALNEFSSSDEEDGSDYDIAKGSPITFAPSSSTPTLVDEPPKAVRKNSKPFTTGDPTKDLVIDYDAELAELKKRKGANVDGIPEYSDHEEDLTSVSQRGFKRQRSTYGSPGRWSPAFMKHRTYSDGLTSTEPASSTTGGTHNGISESAGDSTTIPLPGLKPVPATPSLIKAFDRIAVAQRDAFGHSPPVPSAKSASTSTPSNDAQGFGKRTPKKQGETARELEGAEEEDDARAIEHARKERAPRWEEFWRQVNVKAHS